MKYKTWMKQYCPKCINKMQCELCWKQKIHKELKFFATGAITSISKLYWILHGNIYYCSTLRNKKRNIYTTGLDDISCPVFIKIAEYRLEINQETLNNELEQLERRIYNNKQYIKSVNPLIESLIRKE